MLYTIRFFSSKRSLFHNANLFGSYIIHILYTECAKIKKKNNSGAKGLITVTKRKPKSISYFVYKMWIIQEPNKLALWNKLHFEEKKRRV